MSAIAQQESLVKASLFQFIGKNIPTANLEMVDDIVLSYVISILEEASQDPGFDVEGFIELMMAYVPEFSRVQPDVIYNWILELEADLNRSTEETDSSHDDSGNSDCLSWQQMLPPPPAKPNRSHSNSETESTEASSEPHKPDYSAQCAALADMFPNVCATEIKQCVSIANGDIDGATATLLHRCDSGQTMSSFTLQTTLRQPKCNDNELKNRIIQRYSYVDENSLLKEHKPLAPKFEPKKMVRYRDNKIVSLKGERYTEVSKSGVEENLKKPKKQHCP